MFRGITQSNHKPSVNAYFEPRYNITKDLQLYVGLAGASISFPNRAAAEIDVYGGIRPTFGTFAFDFGVWGYLYPGGTCHYGALPPIRPAFRISAECADQRRCRQRQRHQEGRSASSKVYAKVNYTFNDMFAIGGNEYYYAELPEHRRLRATTPRSPASSPRPAPPSAPAASACTSRANSAASGSAPPTRSTATASSAPFPNGIKYADYNTWNIGVGFTYKVFTLDIRYSDTDLSKGDCNAFTSDFTARATSVRSAPRHGDQSERRRLRTGAARPASSSSRLT